MRQNKGLLIGMGLLIVVAIIGLIAVDSAKKTTKTNSGGTSYSKPTKATPTTGTSGASQASPSPASTSTGSTTAVTIKGYMFEPMDIKVKVGDTVTWTNQDSVQHTVTADSPSADGPNGPLIAKGQSYSFTFKKAGTYSYHCMPHTYMKATVTVTQ